MVIPEKPCGNDKKQIRNTHNFMTVRVHGELMKFASGKKYIDCRDKGTETLNRLTV